jgi:AcrR family transcriptional regulator
MPRADRERLILDVAGTVFARDGYHSASMDEIAATADVSKPMLYAYFASKEGLYVAYINRMGRELVDRLLGAAARAERGSARLRAPISEFLAFVEEHRAGWTVLFHELTASQPLAEEVAQLRGQVAGAVCRMLESSSGGGADGQAADGIAHAIVGAGESIANWWLAHPDVPRAEVTDWYVGLVQSAAGRLR